MDMIASIFDCDGTLYAAQFGRGLLEYAASNGFRNRVRAYYAVILPWYLLRRLKLIRREKFNRLATANLGRLIADWELREGTRAFEWIAYEYLLPTKHPEVVSRLKSHLRQQHRVVLLSGVFVPCLELIGAELGVMDLIGTKLDIHDGRYSGDIIPPVITGNDKLPRLREFIATHGLDIDWGASYAYADSSYDSPILEAVGNPVAVHPDPGLLALARERNWEVIGSE